MKEETWCLYVGVKKQDVPATEALGLFVYFLTVVFTSALPGRTWPCLSPCGRGLQGSGATTKAAGCAPAPAEWASGEEASQ